MVSGGKDKEKEPKVKKRPGRVPTACAECRRLKLRCDKNVPCEKCVSRGCGSICPDGVLTPGKGNRLILANTEELHDRVDQLCNRNRELENALRSLQESVSERPHPLLRGDLLRPPSRSHHGSSSGPSTSSSSKSPTTPAGKAPESAEVKLEDDPNVIDNFGTLILLDKDVTAYLGKTGRPEMLSRQQSFSPGKLAAVSEEMTLIAFPELRRPNNDVASELIDSLPSLSEALHLCDIYLEYGNYFYVPLTRKELLDDVVTLAYSKYLDTIRHLRNISLLFAIFAIATLFDPQKEAYSIEAHEYYHLSRTAYNLTPSTSETAPISMHILLHLACYLDLSESNMDSPDAAWIEIGKASRLAYAVGLHVNPSRWNLTPHSVQKRNDTLIRLFILDTWTSFHLGRPPNMAIAYLDRTSLKELREAATPDGRSHPDLHQWCLDFAFILHSIMEALGPRQPAYNVILDYDRRVRDFDVPGDLRMPPEDERTTSPISLETSICRWIILASKEIALLHLHRPYLMQALLESPGDLQRHRYLPSVVASFRSAWRLVHGLAMTWLSAPKLLARVGSAWSYGFSAGIALCLLVVRAPTSHFTSIALEELDNLSSLFDSAASSCRGAVTHFPSIQRLRQRAHEILGSNHYRFRQQTDTSITLSELDRLGGKTTLIPQASTSMEPPSSSATERHPSRATSVTMSDTPESHAPVFHSTDNLHPTLVHDLKEFSLRGVNFTHPIAFYDHPSQLSPPPQPPPPPPTYTSQPISSTSAVPSSSAHTQQYTQIMTPPAIREHPPPPTPLSHSQKSHYSPLQTRVESHYFQYSTQHHQLSYPDSSSSAYEPRRSMTTMTAAAASASYSSAAGFATATATTAGLGGGFGAATATASIILDPSWNVFVEQLGF